MLFDLDDTLVVEEPAAVAAFVATAEAAAERYELDATALARSARTRAAELWRAGPAYAYCEGQLGVSSWEGLWCRWEGDDPDVRAACEWSVTYRFEAWRLALADQGIDDTALAGELGMRFGAERRLRHEAFADARPVLEELRTSHTLALVTNGASCLQREKLTGSGLTAYLDVVVASGDVGAAKPDRSIFEHTLSRLGVSADRAVMVGDSMARDVEGAIAAGIRGIWLNRDGTGRPAPSGATEISTLAELSEAIA